MLLRAYDEFYLSVRLLLHELFIPLVIVSASTSGVDVQASIYLFIYFSTLDLFICLYIQK